MRFAGMPNPNPLPQPDERRGTERRNSAQQPGKPGRNAGCTRLTAGQGGP